MAEQLVVDASVVLKLYLRDEQYTANADLLFSRFQQGEINLVAPRFITYEVPASIEWAVLRGRPAKETWQAALMSFESLGLTIVDDSDAKYETIRLAIDYTCRYYDALYLLLAEDLGCPFITDDEKLWRPLHTQVEYLLLLASYR